MRANAASTKAARATATRNCLRLETDDTKATGVTVAAAANTVMAGSPVDIATKVVTGTAMSTAVRGSYKIAATYPKSIAGMANAT